MRAEYLAMIPGGETSPADGKRPRRAAWPARFTPKARRVPIPTGQVLFRELQPSIVRVAVFQREMKVVLVSPRLSHRHEAVHFPAVLTRQHEVVALIDVSTGERLDVVTLRQFPNEIPVGLEGRRNGCAGDRKRLAHLSFDKRGIRGGRHACRPKFFNRRLGQDLVHHVSLHVGQAKIAARMAERQPFVLQTE